MRIREEDRNMVLLAAMTLLAAALAGIIALVEPAPAPAQNRPAQLAEQTTLRVVGTPFVPNVNPREHR